MYLHLGQNVMVLNQSIMGIFDMDNATSSHLTREYLNRAEKEGKVINVSDDLPKSFVVCNDRSGTKIYLCQLNSATLLKRFENINNEISEISMDK